MELEFSNLGNKSFDVYETIFNDLYKKTLKFLGISDNYITSVTIVDDEAIHAINKEYRNIDRATDVISFAFYDDPDEPKNNDDAPNVLGEIVISFEHALKQSVEYGHTLEREFSFLFIHGLLHLLGYNHETKEEEMIMFKLQDRKSVV